MLISIDFEDFTSLFTPWFLFKKIKKTYQTFETMFHWLSKHLQFGQKYSGVRRIFNSLLCVWISRWYTVCRVWYITSNQAEKASLHLEVCPVFNHKWNTWFSLFGFIKYAVAVVIYFFRAVRRYTAAIRVDPTYIRAYICRAEAYHKLHMVSIKWFFGFSSPNLRSSVWVVM